MKELKQIKKWFLIGIEYRTTNEKDWERITRKIHKPLKGHYVLESRVFINSELKTKKKRWYEFWK